MAYVRPDNNEVKVKINSKRNQKNFINTWRLNNNLWNDHWIIGESRGRGLQNF